MNDDTLGDAVADGRETPRPDVEEELSGSRCIEGADCGVTVADGIVGRLTPNEEEGEGLLGREGAENEGDDDLDDDDVDVELAAMLTKGLAIDKTMARENEAILFRRWQAIYSSCYKPL